MAPSELTKEVLNQIRLLNIRDPDSPCLIDWENRTIRVGNVIVLMAFSFDEALLEVV